MTAQAVTLEVQQQLQQQQPSSSKEGTPGHKVKAGSTASGLEAKLRAAQQQEQGAWARVEELWPPAIKAVILSPSHELTAQQVCYGPPGVCCCVMYGPRVQSLVLFQWAA